MQELFRILKERYEENKASMLVTVVDGSGSIPRKAGAYMIVGDEGRIYGTIGGGNMEYQAILKGQSLVQETHNHLQEYILTPNKVADLGMICGKGAQRLLADASAGGGTGINRRPYREQNASSACGRKWSELLRGTFLL